MDNILNTITAYREERKWSLYDLAVHAEMKPSTISTWYNDNAIPTIPSLVKICDAFQITLSEFFAKAEGSESADAIHIEQFHAVIDAARCLSCGACAVVCPRHVIKDRFGVLTPVH